MAPRACFPSAVWCVLNNVTEQGTKCGSDYAAVTALTVGSYTAFTIAVTQCSLSSEPTPYAVSGADCYRQGGRSSAVR